jgi:DNA invertase Pin-like site-specific DNA recombinase
MNIVYGYARVSTINQNNDRQTDELTAYPCDELLTEKYTGTKAIRPELNRLKDKVREGDTVVVESWSRLGRSMKDLIELVEWFMNHGVKLVSIKENFDTSTPQGRLMMKVFQSFAEFERDLIVQRVNEGLKSARARGRVGGRPRKNQRAVETALKLYRSGEHSISEICRLSGVSQTTLYRYINREKN